MKYRNVMETIVENKLDKMIDMLDCCHCEQCRNDVVAYALNQLPPKYVVTDQGEVYSKLAAMGLQHDADVTAAISMGAAAVKQHPRHNT